MHCTCVPAATAGTAGQPRCYRAASVTKWPLRVAGFTKCVYIFYTHEGIHFLARTLSLCLAHTHLHTLSLPHTQRYTLFLSQKHTYNILSFAHAYTLSLTHTYTLPLSHTHKRTHSLTHTSNLALSHTHMQTKTYTHTHTHANTHTHTIYICTNIQRVAKEASHLYLARITVCCSVLQCIAVRCSVLQCVAVCCSVLQCVTVCCGVLRCVAVCCIIVLQCVIKWRRRLAARILHVL